MAKKTKKVVKTSSRTILSSDNKLLLFVVGALVLGFIGGFFFARDRYIKRIQTISTMNMEKAVQIDELMMQMRVLGASDSVEK